MNRAGHLIALACATALASCASPSRFQDRIDVSQGLLPNLSQHGSESAIDPIAEAMRQAQDETRLLTAYAIRANVIRTPNDQLPPNGAGVAGVSDWYLIAEAGMNDIGQKCEAYIDAIFQLRKDLNTSQEQISLAGATAATLLGVFGAAADAVAATAAGFGFATQGLTNISDNILFTVEPSGIRKLVGRQQAAYRERVRLAASAVNTRPAAVQVVQGYLATCLPSTIEMQINESVSLTDFFVSNDRSGGANVVLERRATAEDRQAVDIGDNNGANLQNTGSAPVQTFTPQPNDINAPGCQGDECELTRSIVAGVQAALCLPASDRAFAFGPKTRAAIALAKRQPAAPGLFTSGGDTLTTLEAARLFDLPDCPTDRFANALERFAFGSPTQNYEVENTSAFSRLVPQLKASGASFAGEDPAGFTSAFREGLKRWQATKSLTADGEIGLATYDKILNP